MASSSSSHEFSVKKEQKSPKFYGFHTFAEPGCPVSFSGAFRDNIRHFLQKCAEPEDYKVDGMRVWCIFLVYESRGIVLPLYAVEENVKHSENPFCDYCRCSGWSKHFVSKRRYHLIIPVDDDWDKRLDEGSLDFQTHLLHGLIHCNGFGHLLCINGIEGGSKLIFGREIMDLWDRICTVLQTRQISVEDLSMKHMVDLRLLYGIAYGRSWFSNWGYRFCLGSFGVKEHNYKRAIDILSSLELDQVIDNLSSITDEHTNLIKQMIHHYKQLSDTNLVTVRDLLRFMLTHTSKSPTARNTVKFTPFSSNMRSPWRSSASFSLKSGTGKEKEKPAKCRKFSNLAANMDSRWPVRRLEYVAKVIVDALKEKRAEYGVCSCGMTRQEARDAARLHIGDTGLIDHVLKSMNNVIVGNYIVRRATNRATKVLEYTIHDHKGADVLISEKQSQKVYTNPGRNISNDIAWLCKNILLQYPINDSIKLAIETILYSKHFVKEWPFRDVDDHSMRFICRPTSISFDTDDEIPKLFLPREYIVVPLHATVGDLKVTVQNAMRDTYFVMENLLVTDIVEMEGVTSEEVLFGIIESGREILVRGCGLDVETELRHEGGVENWTVKCMCGAQDDDGERMVSCDICEVWQHTLCSGIDDKDSVPRFFVCDSCCGSLAPTQTKYGSDLEMDSLVLPFMPELDYGMILQAG